MTSARPPGHDQVRVGGADPSGLRLGGTSGYRPKKSATLPAPIGHPFGAGEQLSKTSEPGDAGRDRARVPVSPPGDAGRRRPASILLARELPDAAGGVDDTEGLALRSLDDSHPAGGAVVGSGDDGGAEFGGLGEDRIGVFGLEPRQPVGGFSPGIFVSSLTPLMPSPPGSANVE